MTGFRKSIGFELSGYILITMILFLAAILVFSIKYISTFFINAAEDQSMTVLYETDYKIKSFFNSGIVGHCLAHKFSVFPNSCAA